MPAAISVVVRTLGRSGRLADALAVVSAQTWRDFEAVVVDMSGGQVKATLERCAPALPGLRHLAVPGPLGRAAALNAGVAAATAPLIGVLDDDNLYDRDHLAHLVRGLEATGADYVYTGVRHSTYTPDGRRVACRDVGLPFRLDRVSLGNYVYATGSGYRRSLWERLGGYDERFTVFEDWDFVIRAGQRGLVAHLPVVSGESRKFTGLDGVSNFDLEIRDVRRCMAGVYWRHRRLFRGAARAEMKAAAAEHCRRRQPARRGVLARSVRGWRLELLWDVLAWWWWCGVGQRVRRAGK